MKILNFYSLPNIYERQREDEHTVLVGDRVSFYYKEDFPNFFERNQVYYK